MKGYDSTCNNHPHSHEGSDHFPSSWSPGTSLESRSLIFLHLKENKTEAQKGLTLSSGHQIAKKELGWDSGEPSHLPTTSEALFPLLALLTLAATCKCLPWFLSFPWKLKTSTPNSAYPDRLETRSKMRTSHTFMFCPLRCFRKKKTSKSNICLSHHLTRADPLIQAPAFTVSSDRKDSPFFSITH